jgi:hypothetical protein
LCNGDKSVKKVVFTRHEYLVNFLPCDGKSGIAPAKIPVIFLLLIIVQISGQGSSLFAQNDSLALTSVPLTEIASDAARDMQQTRDLLVEEVQVSTSFNLIPQIDSLENKVTELEELSDQIMITRLEYAYYNSLTSSLALQNRITDIDLVIETYLHDIAELQKVELRKSLLTRDESIFNLKKRSDSLYIERARSQSLFSRHQRQGV